MGRSKFEDLNLEDLISEFEDLRSEFGISKLLDLTSKFGRSDFGRSKISIWRSKI